MEKDFGKWGKWFFSPLLEKGFGKGGKGFWKKETGIDGGTKGEMGFGKEALDSGGGGGGGWTLGPWRPILVILKAFPKQ